MVAELIRRNDGVITRVQALDAGMTVKAIEGRLARGVWERIGHGVYFACDRPFGDRARIRGAVWACGPTACATGASALFWLGAEARAPEIVEVTVPRGGRSRAPRGVRLRRRDLHTCDVLVRRGVRVTAPALSVLEAAVSTPGGVEMMDRALGRLVTVDQLKAAHNRNGRRYGSAAAAGLLAAASGGARSEAERRLHGLLRAAGITGWVANFRWGRYVIDVAFPALGLAIEIDGWAFHSDARTFQRDRARQNDLMTEWVVLRFTWWDIVERPDAVLARIRCTHPF